MKFNRTKLTVVFAPLLVLSFAARAWAENGSDIDAAKRINAANDLVRSGKYDEALSGYGDVNPTASNQLELEYNRAVAQYRRGDFDSAGAAFEQASTSSDSSLAAAARYNRGNCFYSNAVQVAKNDAAAAVSALQQAIELYRSALVSNPSLIDARVNIELANAWIKQLQQRQQQENKSNQDQQSNADQPSEQNQQSNPDQPSEQDKQSSEEKQSDTEKQPSESSQKNEPQQGQDQQQNSESKPADSQRDDSQDQQSNSQQSPAGESESGAKGSGQPDPQSPTSEQPQSEQPQPKQKQPSPSESSSPPTAAGDRDENTAADQSKSADDLDSTEQPPSEQKPVPTGALTPAGQSQENQQPPMAAAMGETNAKPTLMTKEEALKLLQAVRDRDMLRRMRQEQIERSQHVPTVRDW